MATTTIGSNPSPNDWAFDASMHQAWIQTYTPGQLGRMIQVAAYCAAASGGGTGGAVAWIDGNPAFYTTSDGMAAGSGTTGAWHTTAADYCFGATDNWEFGFYASKGVWVIYHADSGLTQVKGSAITNTSGGTNISAYGAGAGSMLAYGTYFIVEVYVRRSGSWTKSFMYVRRSGSWSQPPIYVRRSGGWTQVGIVGKLGGLDLKKEYEGIVDWGRGVWEKCLIRWDYDRKRYLGLGAPESTLIVPENREKILVNPEKIIRYSPGLVPV